MQKYFRKWFLYPGDISAVSLTPLSQHLCHDTMELSVDNDTPKSTFVPWHYGAQCWQWHPGVNICAMTLWSTVLTMTPQSHQWLCNFFYSQMAVLGHTVSGTDFFLWFKPTWIQDSWLKDFYVLQSFKILKIFVGDLFSFLFINMLTLTPKSFLPWPPICQNLVTQSL